MKAASRFALLVVGICVPMAQASVLIDDFNPIPGQGPLVRTCPGDIGTPIASTVTGAGILGGERDIRVDLISGPNTGTIKVVVGSYDHSQDGGVKGTSMATWDGIDGNGLVVNPTGLGGVDLTEGGSQDALDVLLDSADLNAKLVFEVFTDGSNSSKFTLNIPGGVGSPQEFVIPYSTFTTNLGAGATFSNVGAVTMMVDGSTVASLDVVVSLLQTTSTLTVAKADALFVDADQNGLVNVGDTIRYTVVINNPDDAENAASPAVLFTDSPPAGTTLVVGSVTTSQGTVTTGNGGGDTTVAVNVGNIADATTVTITFDVVVNSNGPPQVCNQGHVTNGSGLNIPTDDPDTVDVNDPTCTPISYCGDGIVDPVHEQCDDANMNNNDSCTNACTIARCGDGIVETGVEQCDDGNLVDNDGCTNTCTLPRCGDGITQPGNNEQCDDGNLIDNDGCTNTCTLPRCGDGITQPGNNEQCDDGNLVDTDGCTNACTTARCGDGIVETGVEQCDDGNLDDNDACTNACNDARCGDGIIETGVEQCDDGNLDNTDNCLNTCLSATCGDGFVYVGFEQCDDGNMDNNDGCTNQCTTARCGDSIVETGVEECDDGNAVNNDGCTNDCHLPRCGDGIVQAGEDCDDGNTVNTDACTNQCTNARCGDAIIETGVEECDDGNAVNNDGCTNDCHLPRCGDGIVQAGEMCDDGNQINNDGCTNACALPGCGDGIQQPGEECDDGNITGGDGCSPTCHHEVCGNNILDPGEQCDGISNASCNGNQCLSDCTCQPGGGGGSIPTVSQWGLVVLALILLTGMKIRFGRSGATA